MSFILVRVEAWYEMIDQIHLGVTATKVVMCRRLL